jgi:hypothetical protein
MKKDKFNTKFRDYARKLSPGKSEQALIDNDIYPSFVDLLGTNSCIQIGSYPRHTSITPIHDLDILYVLGEWDERNHNPASALTSLASKIKEDYKNPTEFSIKIDLQTHSVTVSFRGNNNEAFSVDIIPAYIYSQNEFQQDKYQVPEIAKKSHGIRRDYYQYLAQEHKEMIWIPSDPRGYIKVATETDNSSNGEFRKCVKLVKRWKRNLEDADSGLKLKSFHLEQVVTRIFQSNNDHEIFDAIFQFFFELPEIIGTPNQIADRADGSRFVDDYLKNFTLTQKRKIKLARDSFLLKLEEFKESDTIERLLVVIFFDRIESEEFLFDSGIKMLPDDDYVFSADGFVKPLPGYSSGWLTKTVALLKGLSRGPGRTRYIEFSVTQNNSGAFEFRWKVKNDENCENPRGEITLNQTRNHPEKTEYVGEHNVECYAIIDNVCIARSRVPVKII